MRKILSYLDIQHDWDNCVYDHSIGHHCQLEHSRHFEAESAYEKDSLLSDCFIQHGWYRLFDGPYNFSHHQIYKTFKVSPFKEIFHENFKHTFTIVRSNLFMNNFELTGQFIILLQIKPFHLKGRDLEVMVRPRRDEQYPVQFAWNCGTWPEEWSERRRFATPICN